MSLREILASEGLVRTALTISPRTKARLNGGSSALKMGVTDLILQLPGKDILKIRVPMNGPYDKSFALKPGWGKLVPLSAANQFIDVLESAGFSKSGHLPDFISMMKSGAPTPGKDSVTHFVDLRGTKTGEVFINNGWTTAGSAIMSAIEGERHDKPWYQGFSDTLSK